MEARERDVLYYRTPSGTFPFRDWKLGLDTNSSAVVDARIARFRGGNFGDSRPIGGGASENRIHFGPGYRLYYGIDGMDLVILLCGGDKSTQGTDIACARKYWDDYRQRRREAKTKKTKRKR
jgi:putative addiction module killer protein